MITDIIFWFKLVHTVSTNTCHILFQNFYNLTKYPRHIHRTIEVAVSIDLSIIGRDIPFLAIVRPYMLALVITDALWFLAYNSSHFLVPIFAGDKILKVMFIWILPLWILSFFVASGSIKLPFSTPLLDDLIMWTKRTCPPWLLFSVVSHLKGISGEKAALIGG